MDQLVDFIRIKNFWASRESIKRLKRQHAEWKKMAANHISGQDLIAEIKNSYNSRVAEHKHD